MRISDTEPHHPQPGDSRRMRRLILSSLLGNSLEWYDFFLYGTAAALVFGPLFFPPQADGLMGTLLAFSGFAVGFVARPLGGIIFGHLGDRHSRKQALIITLALMGGCTFAIGLLPTWSQAGWLAPASLILLRLVQGIASGGEWGGGVLMLSENADPRRQGFFTAWSQMGVSGGFVLSALAFWLVRQLPEAAFLSWGWRLPFLASIVLFWVGLWIRKNIADSAALAAARREAPIETVVPLAGLWRHHRRSLVQAIALRLPENGAVYLFFTFSLVYCQQRGIASDLIIGCVTLAMALEFFSILLWGHLADRFGFRPIYAVGIGGLLLLAFPFFWLLDSGQPLLLLLATVLGLPVCHGAMIGAQPALVAGLFPPQVRYTGLSLSHEVGSILAGGLGPLLAVALLMRSGAAWPVSLLLMAWGLCGALALVSLGQTRGRAPGAAVVTPTE